MNIQKIEEVLGRRIKFVYLFLFFVSIIVIVINNYYTYFWYDEGYSLSIIKFSYRDIWYLTAKDVHPPLYYFLLKTYASIVGDSVLAFRYFSGIPILITIAVGASVIRKQWGNKVAILFIVFILMTPMTYYMASEIRMYSWAMFFVLMAFLFAYQSYTKPSIFLFLGLFLFSLAAAYTHYYALISILGIYGLYFILALVNNRKVIPSFLLVMLLLLLSYLPWLFHLISQVKTVTQDYWIASSYFLSDVMQYFFPINGFKNIGFSYPYSDIIENSIPIFFLLFLIYNALKSRNKKVFSDTVVIFLLFFIPLVVGIFYSVIFRPVFIARYICCFVGLYFLGMALLISLLDWSQQKNVKITLLFFTILLLFDFAYFGHKIKVNRLSSIGLNSIVRYVEQNLDENTAFLYRDSLYSALSVYPLIFRDYPHISKYDSISYQKRSVIDVFKYSEVSSYQNIDVKYKRIYVIEHFPALMKNENLMENVRDSIEVCKYFNIVRCFDLNGCDIFELRRKE